jgi:hypothetical protein
VTVQNIILWNNKIAIVYALMGEILFELAFATAAAAAAAAIVTAVEVLILSALYMSCNSRRTEVSPTVSRKKNVSTVEERIIRSSGIARSSLPNLVGCRGYRFRT